MLATAFGGRQAARRNLRPGSAYDLEVTEGSMRRHCLLGLVAAGGLALPATGQTVDELIAKNIAARGGLAKLRAVTSLRMSGRMTMGPGVEAPILLELKRPSSVRMEFTFRGRTGVHAYDGHDGWVLDPFGPKAEAAPMSAEDLNDAREQADIEGPLVDYKAKGHSVQLVGKEQVNGKDAYKLKLTLKNGDVRYTYLDATSYLEVRIESTRSVRGETLDVETMIGDYRDVGGVMFPHSFESGPRGRPEKQNVDVDKIELNPAIADARFKIPAPAAPATPAEPAR